MKYPLFFFLSIKKVFTIIQSLFSTITVLPNMCLQDNSYYKKKSMWLPDETKLNAIPNCRAYQHLTPNLWERHLKDLCSSSFRTKSKFRKLLYQKKKSLKKFWNLRPYLFWEMVKNAWKIKIILCLMILVLCTSFTRSYRNSYRNYNMGPDQAAIWTPKPWHSNTFSCSYRWLHLLLYLFIF